MRIIEGVEELGPYPEVIPPSLAGGLRDSIVCNPCNGPMYWEGEVEHWSCPTCPNKKTLTKRVTPMEKSEQLEGFGQLRSSSGDNFTHWVVMGLTVIIGYLMYTDYLDTRRLKKRKSWR